MYLYVCVCVTCHSEGLDAGLHLSPVLLLQPGTVQQSDRRLEQLSHDGVMSLSNRDRLMIVLQVTYRCQIIYYVFIYS